MTTTSRKISEPDPRRWKALVLLCVAFFMVILDSSIVLVALPSIGADLSFSSEDLQWVMSAYLLSFGGLLLLGGRLADLLGRRRMFVLGMALFALASLLCGFAWSAPILIAARVLQGVAAAVMVPAALAVVMTTFADGAERNKALGVWTSTGAIGGTAGWLIGGPITSALGWEWVFFINVPVALVISLLSLALLHESRDSERERRFDAAGAITVTAGLVVLVYAVVEAPTAGWLSGRTLGLLAASAALIAAFVAIESRSAAPLVPLRVFRVRTLVGGNLVLLLLGMAAFGMPFILTLYSQEVLGYSALLFGVAFVVMPVMAALASAVGQNIVTKAGFRGVAAAGMLLIAAGLALLTQVSAHGSYFGDLFFSLPLLGAGVGAAYLAGSVASLDGVAEEEAGLASGLNNASFQIGAAIGVAIVSTVVTSNAVGADPALALTEGAQAGFTAAIAFPVLGLIAAAVLLGKRRGGGAIAVDGKPAAATAAG